MVFRVGFIPAVGLSILGSLFIFDRLFNKPPFVGEQDKLADRAVKSCVYGQDFAVPPLRDLSCILDWFFKDLVADKLATALIFIVFQLWAPLSLWWAEQGGKDGHSLVFSPVVLVGISLMGQAAGIGPSTALLLPALYALFKTMGAQREGIAPPASAFYTFANFALHQVGLGTLLGTIGISPKEPVWTQIFFAFQLYPLVLLPLQFLPNRKPKKSDAPRTTNIFDFWGFIFIPTWWANLAYVLYLYVNESSKTIKPSALFLVWDGIGVFTALFSIYTIDYLAGDAKGLPSFLGDLLWAGPPAATARYFAAKERQGAKRALTLKKTK